MAQETTFKFTVGTMIAALIMMASSLVWAGSISAHVERGKIERHELLGELRELRKEVQDLRIQTTRMMAEMVNLGKQCDCKE